MMNTLQRRELSERQEQWFPIIKWAILYILLLLFHTLQVIPYAFEFFGVKPVFVLLLVIPVAMFQEIIPSAVYGMVAGFLLDLAEGSLFGFNALVLLILSAAVSFLCLNLLHTRLINTLWVGTIFIFLQLLLYYFFDYFIWEKENQYVILLRYLLPSAAYTFVLLSPMYFLVKLISSKLSTEETVDI